MSRVQILLAALADTTIMEAWYWLTGELGATWVAANWMLKESVRRNQTVYWCREVCYGHPSDRDEDWHDAYKIQSEVLSLLDSPGHVEIVERKGVKVRLIDIIEHPAVSDYYPTKPRWKPNDSRIICYHFSSNYEAARKNPKADEVSLFLSRMKGMGYTTVPLGLPLTVTQDVEWLAKAEYFVGVESGPSHVCHSVGTPMFMLRNNWDMNIMLSWHVGKPFTYCKNLDDFWYKFNGVLREKHAIR